MSRDAEFHGELTDEEQAFSAKCAEYMRVHRKRFLANSDYLAVAHALGYRRVADPEPVRPIGRNGGGRRTDPNRSQSG